MKSIKCMNLPKKDKLGLVFLYTNIIIILLSSSALPFGEESYISQTCLFYIDTCIVLPNIRYYVVLVIKLKLGIIIATMNSRNLHGLNHKKRRAFLLVFFFWLLYVLIYFFS